MKKFLIMISLCLIVAVTYCVPTFVLDVERADAKVFYYTRGDVSGTGTYMFDNVYMTACSYREHNKVERKLSNVIGITYTFSGDYDDYREILTEYRVGVVETEVVDGIHIIYGMSEQCGQPRIVDGKPINIQLAIKDNVITVGTPLIMGSY